MKKRIEELKPRINKNVSCMPVFELVSLEKHGPFCEPI